MDKDALKTFKKTDLVEIFVVWINHFTARINISTFTQLKPLGHPTSIFGKYLFGRRFEI